LRHFVCSPVARRSASSLSLLPVAGPPRVQPETKYARLGGDRIAYQVLGQGPPDLVMTTGGFSQIDIVWEDPGIALFLRTLASFSRLILFDRRGQFSLRHG